MRLGVAQARALEHVGARAERARARARHPPVVDQLAARLRERPLISLNFHPDRRRTGGRTVAEGLLADGRYLSQFVTGLSNGSRTAFAGGERDRWERELFGGAYQEPGVQPDERPKYGALNLMDHPDGGSPRFGSCWFELRAHVTARATFTWGDSHEGPEHVGTLEVFEPILAALLASGIEMRSLLGHDGGVARRANGRALDVYVEAQVHGDIALSADVSRLVVDPSFEGTATGDALAALCASHGIPMDRHAGFVLEPRDVPDDFRGPRMVPLAERVEREFAIVSGRLDAAAIGRAADSLVREPERWKDWGSFEETLQHLKQLWHVLVQFGQ